MTVTLFELYYRKSVEFWRQYDKKHPDFPTNDIYYEVLLDFWEDVFDENLPLDESLEMAYKYLKEHSEDY